MTYRRGAREICRRYEQFNRVVQQTREVPDSEIHEQA